ncbi:hypothetical protein GOBAR_AA21966 [Gossypium barbadense]|uniref:RNA helicase n=1 Tax=Gossypium barbadense TaxID=3634 RepID=A0A2P5X5U7_GOSBA|nr:hypothetical protein GOBAR_AA21966 [Gossypium barbadense]
MEEDWTPSVDASTRIKENLHGLSVRTKSSEDENSLNMCQPSQADWIRQYMEQQEEDESKTWEDEASDEGSAEEVSGPRPYDVIAKEYHAARLEATKAKEKKDKNGQEKAGSRIRKLKQELSALGLSDAVLASDLLHERASASVSEGTVTSSMPEEPPEMISLGDAEWNSAACVITSGVATGSVNDTETSKELSTKYIPSLLPTQEKGHSENMSEDLEIGDFFLEDSSINDALASEVLKLQKQEKMKELYSEKNLEKLDGIWKKGESKKIPKAVLHQLCQRSGWEAPKFDKMPAKASGRGKSRKAGGLTTLQLPNEQEAFESAEDAQNRVAAFALCQLFPDLPTQLIVTEPYSSLIFQWKGGESLTKIGDNEEDRRAGFVDRLLRDEDSRSKAPGHDTNESALDEFQKTYIEDNKTPCSSVADPVYERKSHAKEMESVYLRQEEEKRKHTQRYKFSSDLVGEKAHDLEKLLSSFQMSVQLGTRGKNLGSILPLIKLTHKCTKSDIPTRKSEAISVAERVADERCEPSPGSIGSLVGYQVRLDNARNEKTKLLFCTTGILLRKLADAEMGFWNSKGDKNLTGVTHIIVDEVHERSLLVDVFKIYEFFWSATVDSDLFSRYFGLCPVITAQGRTHPVTTCFLEDICERISYHLASDSPASLRCETSTRDMRGPVNNRRGKKNLVLSAWGDDSLLSEEYKRLNEDVIDYDLLEDLVCHVDETCDKGAILIFLPGVVEIHTLLDRLAASYRFAGPSSDWLLPLHSSIAADEQKKVFLNPPDGIRKVIIATNIAETSITIDDVVYVIDCGKHKENRYNPQKKLSSMVEDWISRANAKQRRGRAGRVKPGICFCLYTRHRFEKLMRPYQVPEMLRMPLVELCLQIKLLSLGQIKPFLSKALEPPKEEAMNSAISLLYEIKIFHVYEHFCLVFLSSHTTGIFEYLDDKESNLDAKRNE